MAVWIRLQEASKQLDEKLKAQLLKNHTEMMQNHRTRRFQRLKSTVRQLYSEGQSDQAESLWEQFATGTSTLDSDEDSNSSQES